MKLELTTSVCKLIQPDIYGSEICYKIADGCREEVEKLAMEIGEEYLNEAFEETELFCTSDCAVTKFGSPKYYNYETNWLEFDFECPDYIPQRIVEKYYGDEKFFEYIKKKFGSHPGFASFMPVEPARFFAALTKKSNGDYDFERAISYEVTSESHTPGSFEEFWDRTLNKARAKDSYAYQLLGRMKQDCGYYLGNGNRNEKCLWGTTPEKHIQYMKELWAAFPDDGKPEWLTKVDIWDYEKKMIGKQ